MDVQSTHGNSGKSQQQAGGKAHEHIAAASARTSITTTFIYIYIYTRHLADRIFSSGQNFFLHF